MSVRVSIGRVRLATPLAGGVDAASLERQVARDLRLLLEGREGATPTTVSTTVSRAVSRELHDRIAGEGGRVASAR